MTTLAAVDIGSNAVRLLIARDGSAIERRSEITRLGEGVAHRGELAPEAIERTAAVLAAYRGLIRDQGATLVRAVGTAAVRAAANRDDLLAAAEAALGRVPEILSAEHEARLSFRGTVAGLPSEPGPRLVIDIGGGSTELVVGTLEPEAFVSLDLGSATLTEAELPSDPPRPEELSNAVALVHDAVDDALRSLPGANEAQTLVGVGGTITTVAAVELGLPVDEPLGARDVADAALHGFFLSRAAAEDVFRTLAGEPLRDRIHNPGLPRQRAPVIIGGCCIVVGVIRRLQARGLVVSLSDLLDGLVAEAG